MPIASLDADTLVAPGYLTGIIRKFRNSRVAGITLAYAHRYEGEECTEILRQAIIRYELYLRYYQQALEYCGHPYAYTCIGSAFAVRAADYVLQGGMNKRQAGEDFYFIQKLISTGGLPICRRCACFLRPGFQSVRLLGQDGLSGRLPIITESTGFTISKLSGF